MPATPSSTARWKAWAKGNKAKGGRGDVRRAGGRQARHCQPLTCATRGALIPSGIARPQPPSTAPSACPTPAPPPSPPTCARFCRHLSRIESPVRCSPERSSGGPAAAGGAPELPPPPTVCWLGCDPSSSGCPTVDCEAARGSVLPPLLPLGALVARLAAPLAAPASTSFRTTSFQAATTSAAAAASCLCECLARALTRRPACFQEGGGAQGRSARGGRCRQARPRRRVRAARGVGTCGSVGQGRQLCSRDLPASPTAAWWSRAACAAPAGHPARVPAG